MNFHRAALLSVVILALSGSSSSVDAGVKGNGYSVVGFTSQSQAVQDSYYFTNDGTLITNAASGDYIDIDLIAFDLWFATVNQIQNGDITLTTTLQGIQFGTFFLAVGQDSSDVTYYLFGTFNSDI